jgi:hypothetical protein
LNNQTSLKMIKLLDSAKHGSMPLTNHSPPPVFKAKKSVKASSECEIDY